MVAKVIPFPDKYEPNIPEIEKLMREWLCNVSDEHNFIDTVAARMMSFIQNYANTWFEPNFNLSVPPTLTFEERKALIASIETGVDETARQAQEMVNRIIIERFLLEIEIYETSKNQTHFSLNGK